MAASMDCSETSTTSSTSRVAISSGMAPIDLTAMPSAIVVAGGHRDHAALALVLVELQQRFAAPRSLKEPVR